MKLPIEIVSWAKQLLKQTQTILEKAESGEAAIPPEDIARLRKTEQDLNAALEADEQ